MPQAHITHPKRGIPSLDGWRAISILMVLALHARQGNHFSATSQVGNILLFIGTNGGLGVRIFFVISGYLITRLLLREQEKNGHISLRGFYVRRVFRILPPLYLYLAVIVAFIFAGRVMLSLRYPAMAAAFLTSYTDSHDPDFWTLEHTWSLCVEEQFYLLWPFALVWALRAKDAVLRQRRAMRVAIISIVVIAIVRIPWWMKPYTSLHFLGNAVLELDGILFGALAAVAEGHKTFELWYRKATARPWLLLVLLFLVSSALEAIFPGKYIKSIGAPFDGFIIMWLLLWTVREPETLLGRFLNWKPITWIGILSYSLYLWQTIFLHQGSERILGFPRHLPVPLDIVLIFIAGSASFYLVEQPVLRLRDRLFRQSKKA